MTTLDPSRTHLLSNVEIVEARSSADLAAVFDLRRLVFRDEQHMVSGSVEDPDDRRSTLVLARLCHPGEQPRPVATGRITFNAGPGGEAVVTWVATRPELRGRGIGAKVMRYLLDAADHRNAAAVILAAQEPAVDFYRRLGFTPDGKWYLVTGVNHLPMRRLSPGSNHAHPAPALEWW